jgi:hypothetical protein
VAKQTNESSLVRRERSLPRGYILCPKKQKKKKKKRKKERNEVQHGGDTGK